MEPKIVFIIPSYERAESIKNLVEKIHGLGEIYVLQDGGKQNYSFLLDYGVNLYKNKSRNGKEKFYQTVSTLFQLVYGTMGDYYFFIPDDLDPVDNFHSRAINCYNSIHDPNKIALNLFLEQSRIGKPCWTQFEPKDLGNVYLTQWIDMCFLCQEKFFNMIGWAVPTVKRDFKHNPELGSGVGSVISKRLYFLGFNMYQVKSSLFKSTEYCLKSKMNPKQNNPLIHKEVT